MKTYAIRDASRRALLTGHLRRPGTETTYCGRPIGTPNGDFHGLRGWTMHALCVQAEARDRAEATVTATAALDPESAGTLPAMVCIQHGDTCDGDPRRRHNFRPAPTDADRAAAELESRQMAELITEAEATDGTWRGEWIGARDDATLFALPGAEQGSLFT